jgi:ABC-type uncharacterized transport system involved in gliding motility auxiliary subunit
VSRYCLKDRLLIAHAQVDLARGPIQEVTAKDLIQEDMDKDQEKVMDTSKEGVTARDPIQEDMDKDPILEVKITGHMKVKVKSHILADMDKGLTLEVRATDLILDLALIPLNIEETGLRNNLVQVSKNKTK